MNQRRLTPEDLDALAREYPEVFETWIHQGKRELIAQEPRDPWGRGQSDRDLDRARRNTPGIVLYDEPPLEDVSNANAILQGDNATEICRVKYRACQELTAVVRVFPPQAGSFAVASGSGNVTALDATDPFNNLTGVGMATLPATIPQTTEVIGYVLAAHQNTQIILPFNMPLGQILRVQTVGSMLNVSARLTPRYTPKLGAGSVFSWLVAPTGSNFERNNAFDNPPALSSFVTPSATPLRLEGFCGKAFTAPVPVKRVFFGWVDALAAVNTQHLCPVPRGAMTALLKADGSTLNNDPGVGAAFNGVGLMFNEICQSPGAGTFRRLLNQPANQTILLSSDCVCIEVVNTTVPVAGSTPRFELIYDLGM